MYVIKMNGDKTLQTTIYANIYQGEKNADMLVFLVPKLYGNQNLADSQLLLRYITPDGLGHSEALEMALEPYNDNYYRYNISVDTGITKASGDIELWLSAISIRDNVVFKTDSIVLPIQSSKEIENYLSPADRSQLNALSAKVSRLEVEKADNIFYDEQANALQLSANGDPIGDKINVTKIMDDDGSIDFDQDSTSSGNPDDVIYF